MSQQRYLKLKSNNAKGKFIYIPLTYNELLEKVSKDKLVALAECDVIPDIEELKENHFPFIYYMTWSKEFCLTEKYNSNEKLKEFYKDKDTIKQ